MNLITKLSMFLLLIAALTLASCGGNTASSTDTGTDTMEEANKQGPEYTSAYICPMHCKGSGSAEAGTCPVCKMEYVANTDQDEHKGHNH